MLADFSVELGRGDPILEWPWSSDDSAVRYYDLKTQPELVREIPEAQLHPELGTFLLRMNAPGFPLLTAKCDAWPSRDISPEEEIFGAECKFVSYVDLIFVDEKARGAFARHESFAEELCRLLQRAPEIAATGELVIRRCYWHGENSFLSESLEQPIELGRNAAKKSNVRESEHALSTPFTAASDLGKEEDIGEMAASQNCADAKGEHTLNEGFSFSAYVAGFGATEDEASRAWEIAVVLLQNAIVQLASR